MADLRNPFDQVGSYKLGALKAFHQRDDEAIWLVPNPVNNFNTWNDLDWSVKRVPERLHIYSIEPSFMGEDAFSMSI